MSAVLGKGSGVALEEALPDKGMAVPGGVRPPTPNNTAPANSDAEEGV